MKIVLSWLNEFVRVPVAPEKLAHDLTLIGFELESLETHGGETVLDLAVTTNRVDCMNVYGMAREISVLYEVPLQPLALAGGESGERGGLDVAIEAPDLCTRFCARVLDVKVGPSPDWLQRRLEAAGVRPI